MLLKVPLRDYTLLESAMCILSGKRYCNNFHEKKGIQRLDEWADDSTYAFRCLSELHESKHTLLSFFLQSLAAAGGKCHRVT